MIKQFAIPFAPKIDLGGDYAQITADALNRIIKKSEEKGWQYSHIEQIVIYRQNGCVGALFGNPATPITVQVAILIRE